MGLNVIQSVACQQRRDFDHSKLMREGVSELVDSYRGIGRGEIARPGLSRQRRSHFQYREASNEDLMPSRWISERTTPLGAALLHVTLNQCAAIDEVGRHSAPFLDEDF